MQLLDFPKVITDKTQSWIPRDFHGVGFSTFLLKKMGESKKFPFLKWNLVYKVLMIWRDRHFRFEFSHFIMFFSNILPICRNVIAEFPSIEIHPEHWLSVPNYIYILRICLSNNNIYLLMALLTLNKTYKWRQRDSNPQPLSS